MACRYVLMVLEEHLSKAIEEVSKELIKFGKIHKIPFEGKYLLDYEIRFSHENTEALIRLRDRGVAFNAVGMNYRYSVRFDHLGELHEAFRSGTDEVAMTVFEHLRLMMWPDGCNLDTAELRAYCVSMRFCWEDQAKHGRLYAMLNMLGK